MGMLNKRNAVLGWAAWQVGKRAMKLKARDAVPGVDETKRPNKSAIAAVLAAAGGALFFWRRRRSPE
jgi:MYXO-CTERM domain-containing protein